MKLNAAAAAATRRRFLKTTGATAAAAAFGGINLRTSRAQGKTVTVGSGEHTYECIHDWGASNLPEGHHYGGATHGVAIDSQGLIYVTHHGGPESIFVFDPDGNFVKAMGEGLHRIANPKNQNGQCHGHGIDFRKENGEEFIYLSPNHSNLFFAKMTRDGEVVWKKDRKALQKETEVFKDGKKPTFRPTNASFRPDGGYYLGDGYGSHYLFEYDKDDNFVRAIGGNGKEDGKFATPHGQWLDDRDGTPKLVVADRANKRLQWFDMAGKHLKTLDGFLFPADIDVRGDVLMVPDLHARITLLDKDDKVIAQLGDDEEWRQKVLGNGFAMRKNRAQWQPGKFIHPHDACFDKDGNIFVAEWVVTGRVTKLRKV